ncbi:DUF3552 domain-containing protein [Candidatus Shapirobacteria bacterium]|nr:DUF3552 domain-containing protein [Candidatus Shapirobacteria bacterium]
MSKFKGIFGGPVSTPATPAPVKKSNDDDSNRVVFKSTKAKVKATPAPAPVVAPVTPVTIVPPSPQAVVQATVEVEKKTLDALERAKQMESSAKAKEDEIIQRLRTLDSKEQYLISKEKTIDQQNAEVKSKLTQVEELYKKQLDKLEQVSGLDVEKAKQLILSSTERKLSSWIAKKIEEAKTELTTKEEELAKEILLNSIQHGVTDYVAEYTVSTLSLQDEKIKGKIIGREGRNIRAFEKATGVELELDETNDIRISSFDSTRREIARLSLEKLVKDGRIQPVKIEQVVAQTRADMDKILMNEGKRICQEVGVFNLPLEIIKHIGMYKFRFSYGQNLAKHTIEAVKIAVAIALELKADVNTVRLGTLLHDIGKVITNQEGTHIDLGVDLLRQHHLPQAVINCVAEHHSDDFTSPESICTYLGDAASGARPGARYEVHEEYLKRMTNIEDVAKTFAGVTSVAAYQAGREVMVIVDPGVVSDSEAQVLSHNIAEKLDEEAKWAGQIRVTVVRETRTSAVIVGSKINKSAVKNDE